MPKKPQKLFVGIPKNIFPKSPKTFFIKTSEIFFRQIQEFFSAKNKKNFQDNSRIKYIKQTKKDSIRYRLEKQAYFPQENESILQVFKKSFLHYFLPFPPEPPWKDPREKSNGSQSQAVLSLIETHKHLSNKHTYLMPQTPLKTLPNTPQNIETQNKEVTELIPIIGHNNKQT